MQIMINWMFVKFQARQILESEFDRLLREGTNRKIPDCQPNSWDRANRVRGRAPNPEPDDEEDDDDDTISASDHSFDSSEVSSIKTVSQRDAMKQRTSAS